jgi:hypothetical protein
LARGGCSEEKVGQASSLSRTSIRKDGDRQDACPTLAGMRRAKRSDARPDLVYNLSLGKIPKIFEK